MCGRFSRALTAREIAKLFGAQRIRQPLEPSWNVAPTQHVTVLTRDADAPGATVLDAHRWGLVPHWQKGRAGAGHINARAETLAEKPAFREALPRRRCAVVATGFYEWRNLGAQKRPHHIRPAAGGALAMAAVWSPRERGDGSTHPACAIVTTEANGDVAPIHHRMPALLAGTALDAWLDPRNSQVGDLLPLLGPAPDGALAAVEVSTRVNHAGNDGPDLVEPTGGRTATLGEWGVGE